MIAGGLGGTMGDMLMHSLDTVKTRQQGDPHLPPKYTSMASTSYTIWRQEGVVRGLYSGVTPAFIGSFTGTVIFFGAYEWTKRRLIDMGLTPDLSYLTAGQYSSSIIMLTIDISRFHRRSGFLTTLRPLRSHQNPPPASRQIQQSPLYKRLQLPLSISRSPNHRAHRRHIRALFRLQSHHIPRPAILCPAIRLLRKGTKARKAIHGKSRH